MGPSRASIRTLAGYLAGIVVGTTSITLLFLGMRAVMDVGGACADGGPYVSAQPCPPGVPLAMIGGMFGLFAAAGWPALFLSLGFNFLDYAFHPPDTAATPVWGWLVPGVVFWLMGGGPLAIAIAAWREARAGRPGNRLSRQVASGMPLRRAPSGPTSGQTATGLATTPTIATDPEARRLVTSDEDAT